MEETAIITIRFGKKFEEDFEVPVNSRIEKWCKPVEDYLKHRESSGYTGSGVLKFSYNGEMINSRSSLQDMNIWDGAILDATWV